MAAVFAAFLAAFKDSQGLFVKLLIFSESLPATLWRKSLQARRIAGKEGKVSCGDPAHNREGYISLVRLQRIASLIMTEGSFKGFWA